MTGYLPKPVTGVSLPTQPLYLNTMTRTTQSGIPIAESTPIPQLGPVLHRPTPTPRVPIASERARSRYVDRHMRSVPSSSNDRSLVSANLAREIQEFCSLTEECRPYEKETFEAMLENMLDTKINQKQLQQRERDEIYKQMTSNLEKVRAIARESISRASTISVEERQMALSEIDFQQIKDKMNKIDQKIKGLHQNWQAEHREAITHEQCDDIRKFYERHVQKYETKYKILYRMPQQALDRLKSPSSGVSVSTPPKVPASKLTPSLVALDDVAMLKRQESEKEKLAKEKPHVFSTKEGRLTPTEPVYEDMRTVTPFHVTTVESTEGLSVAEGGEEIEKVTQKFPDPVGESESRKVPPVSVASSPDKIGEKTRQEDMTGRNTITKTSSREDALASTRCFFGNDTEVKSVPEVPVTTTMSVSQTDTPPTTSALVVEHTELSPVRTIPYSGTPPRPTATATLRPRTLEQRRSEGQVETQSQDNTSSESDTLEPLVMEGLPDELGPEWRILHPFDIPGVRNPTENTPPTHRRLAENDTLVELIQTAEYLEDVPSWEQRRFYPP